MPEIRTVTVIGAGTMGRGIAEVSAVAGFQTVLYDVDPGQLERAVAAIAANFDRAVAADPPRLSADAAAAARARIRTTTDFDEAARAGDAAIEAVPELLDLKLDVFRRLDAAAAAGALLASNTSTMSITKLAGATGRPERVVGMHFFNPVPRLKLVEVIRGERSAQEAVDRAVELARRLGKDPIVVKDSPGFASSRLGVALGNEAMRMLEQGVASATDIDKAMRLGYNHPMGPLELADLVGLDARLNNARYLDGTLGEAQFQPPAILERLVAEGHLGRKTGRGFYHYDASGKKLGEAI